MGKLYVEQNKQSRIRIGRYIEGVGYIFWLSTSLITSSLIKTIVKMEVVDWFVSLLETYDEDLHRYLKYFSTLVY